MQGRIEINGESYDEGQFVVLAAGAGPVPMQALQPSRVMLAGGAPLDGPRHIWWNFVSSSLERIERRSTTGASAVSRRCRAMRNASRCPTSDGRR